MRIEDILIRKEEVPIILDTNFEIPIHPLLLQPGSRINPKLANSLFEKAAQEWYEDLLAYSSAMPESQNKEKEWIKSIFLKSNGKIENVHRVQRVKEVGWEDTVGTDENGFASHLSISRNGGS